MTIQTPTPTSLNTRSTSMVSSTNGLLVSLVSQVSNLSVTLRDKNSEKKV